MATIHFLNVGQGDCTIIQHNSGRVSMIDICKGNYYPTIKPRAATLLSSTPTVPKFTTLFSNYQVQAPKVPSFLEIMAQQGMLPQFHSPSPLGLALASVRASKSASGNFGMSSKPTNPIEYLRSLKVTEIFRFILTHPDMDHLDGFDALMDVMNVLHFWDSGVRKEKPDFNKNGRYREEDWDRYQDVISNLETVKVITPAAGSKLQFANEPDDRGFRDGLCILAPGREIVQTANDGGDVNDASYVLIYRVGNCRIIIPGDAHDDTWAYVLKHYRKDVANCTVLFAPHHGRKSARDFGFLDVLRPEMTFFGCASSGDLAYDAWSSRGLPVITNNQAGNIVLETSSAGLNVYVENDEFAKKKQPSHAKNAQGYSLVETLHGDAVTAA